MTCIRELLQATSLPRLEAQMVLQQVLQVSRSWLVAHDTDPLDESCVARFRALELRRQAGEPMAYLIGVREFMGHDFQVGPGVLIPRPDTEVLVETAVSCIRRRAAEKARQQGAAKMTLQQPSVRVLDLGTGSGAIAVSVALACPQACVTATDASLQALEVARTNARNLGAAVTFHAGSWYDALPPGTDLFDLIVSNPPYIRADDPHLIQGDLRFEPVGALTDGHDGLTALKAIIGGANVWLKPGGALWLEHGWDQAAAVREQLVKAGFNRVESLTDLAGIERISGGYL